MRPSTIGTHSVGSPGVTAALLHADALVPPLRGRVRQLATLGLSCRYMGAN